jgi:lysophospholipase L1-like esterase
VPVQPVSVTVLAVGDSVMLGSSAQLRLQIPNITVDAVVGRQASDTVNLLRWRASVGRLADVVVIHMGTNGYFSAKQFDDMMKALAGVRRVVFVNDKVPRRWESYNNAVIAAGVQRYPNAVLVDWYSATASQPALFSKDGTHPQLVGQRLYARMILEGITRP